MPACSFGIWILFLHVNRSIRMKTDENSLYLGAFHRRKPPAENASLHACRAHDNHPPPLAAFVRRQCGGFRRAALRWAGAPGRRRSGALAPLRARCRAKPGSGRVGCAPPAAPARNPTATPSPTPAHLPRPCDGCPGDAGRMGRPRGSAAFGGPGAQGPPGLPNKKAGAGGKASPLLFRALRAPPPPPAPGPLELPPPPKRATQSPAPRSMGPGTPIHGRKGRGNGPAPWGKAAAHALRAAAAQPACRGPPPQGVHTRCCANIAARVGPPPA